MSHRPSFGPLGLAVALAVCVCRPAPALAQGAPAPDEDDSADLLDGLEGDADRPEDAAPAPPPDPPPPDAAASAPAPPSGDAAPAATPAPDDDDDDAGFQSVSPGLPPFGTGRYAATFYELSSISVPGGAVFGGSAGNLRGIRFHEHAGILGLAFANLCTAIVVAAGAVDVKSTSHTSDYGTYTVTETTTTYTQIKSDEQVRSEIAEWQRDNESTPFTFAFELYGPGWPSPLPDTNALTGGRFEFGGAFALGEDLFTGRREWPWIGEFGVSYANLKRALPDTATREFRELAAWVRLLVPLTNWAEAHAALRLNLFSILDEEPKYVSPSPVELGVTANLTDRLFLRATGSLGLFRGWHTWGGLEAGVRL